MANPGKPADIFIVEDNDPDVFLVEEALRSQGIQAQIQRCQDGEEAIQALSQIGSTSLPDLIIIDLNLPKITGLDILKHVRSLKQLDPRTGADSHFFSIQDRPGVIAPTWRRRLYRQAAHVARIPRRRRLRHSRIDRAFPTKE